MTEKTTPDMEASSEQNTYARVLEKGMYFGLILLFITFAIYAFGIMKPYIPRANVSQYWCRSVSEYLHMADVHAGWSWLGMLRFGDFINFIPIAILAGTTAVCYLSIIPILWRNNDKVYALIALLEVIVLAVAASGILGSGGH